jgi:hypothetical protein
LAQQYCWIKKGTVMKFSSISAVRSSASALVLAGTVLLGISGIANAQYGGTSGQTKENPADYSDKKDPIQGSTGESGSDKGKGADSKKGGQKEKYYGMPKDKEEMDTGYVDQKKRVDRSKDGKDAASPPDFPRDKEGRPMKDPKYEQGGPIGPN